jgi:hypothetical protein
VLQAIGLQSATVLISHSMTWILGSKEIVKSLSECPHNLLSFLSQCGGAVSGLGGGLIQTPIGSTGGCGGFPYETFRECREGGIQDMLAEMADKLGARFNTSLTPTGETRPGRVMQFAVRYAF